MTATAFKILTADQWAQLQRDGIFHGAPIDIADGYIHMSTAEQVLETLAKHFAGQDNLTIAEIDLTSLPAADLRWEPARNGAIFPHLYAPLTITSVLTTRPAPSPQSNRH